MFQVIQDKINITGYPVITPDYILTEQHCKGIRYRETIDRQYFGFDEYYSDGKVYYNSYAVVLKKKKTK